MVKADYIAGVSLCQKFFIFLRIFQILVKQNDVFNPYKYTDSFLWGRSVRVVVCRLEKHQSKVFGGIYE